MIEINNVSKKFKNVTVLDSINMILKENSIYAFVGHNGSGKSVLLKLICCFYIPTNGTILIDKINYNETNSFPNNIRAFIESPNFIPDLTGLENLQLLAKIQNKISDKEIIDALEVVNLLEEKTKKYCEYSLGMKQKLGIASVLMENPKIMILDEPFNGIDEKSKKQIIDYIKMIKKDKIIIITSHIKEEINSIADIIYEFNNGNAELIK